MTMRKRRIFHSLLVVFLLASLEILSLAGLHALEWLRPGSVVELSMARHFRNKVTPGFLRFFTREWYHPTLGWLRPPLEERENVNAAGDTWFASTDSLGARKDPHQYERLIAATYGDSFTFGHEINNDETWQSTAASQLGGAILNFGVGAYGILQAVMRAEDHLRAGLVAPATVLGIYENNLDRTVMAFRPFKYPEARLSLTFMPTLRLRGDRLVEFRNPWQDPTLTRDELRQLAISVADYDYWAEYKARISFPFTLALLHSSYRAWKGARRSNDLWNTHEGTAIANALVERFVTTVRGQGSLPVILFFPLPKTLRGESPPGYAAVRDSLRRRYADVVILDVNEREFDRRLFNTLPFEGHASATGNRVIAAMLVEALADVRPVAFDWSPCELAPTRLPAAKPGSPPSGR